MAEPFFVPGMPDELRSAAEYQAEREGVHWTTWVTRVLQRELSRHPHTAEPLRRSFFGGGSLYPLLANEPVLAVDYPPEGGAFYPSNLRTASLFHFSESKSFGIYGLSLFWSRIDQGAMLLSAAFLEEADSKFLPRHERVRVRRSNSWFERLVTDCRDRSKEVQQALLFNWEPRGRAAELAIDAFRTLSELTQTSWELQRLCEIDRPKAFVELAHHIEIATKQFELNARLVAEIEGIDAPAEHRSNRLADTQAELLQRAGGGLSLTKAADRSSVSRQAMHKRAKAGTALGLMLGNQLVFPMAQWVTDGKKLVPIQGLSKVIPLFAKSGGWSALQFLIEQDPNLGTTPRLALIEGRLEEVLSAAEAYLGQEEDE
ncbi:hypothetical protein SAMCCGM7_pA0025 (plasmid) [Sinorhizobium americanum CCGM7]|uniref:hypothetical protein n=1 Tax=Sinorhizobium americanum TaxID=194963 RepID=UPI0004D7C66C|nr:hypothetical protein [Sinorhizobium americanum]APG86364.1 hypothetical protein SAMCCGM7_pA0025 [Sinorhizobium americanum CCGM7]